MHGNGFSPLKFSQLFSIVAFKPSNMREKKRDKLVKKKGDRV